MYQNEESVMRSWTSFCTGTCTWSEPRRTRWTSCKAENPKSTHIYAIYSTPTTLTARNYHFSQFFAACSWRRSLPTPFCRLLALGQQIGVVISVKLLAHFSQSHFAQKHQPNVVFPGSEAVVGRFSDHVSEVNSLAEHVACNWCFWWCNPESLAKYAYEVGETRAVPEQHFVGNVGGIPWDFVFLFEFENVHNSEFEGSVGGCVSVGHVLQ